MEFEKQHSIYLHVIKIFLTYINQNLLKLFKTSKNEGLENNCFAARKQKPIQEWSQTKKESLVKWHLLCELSVTKQKFEDNDANIHKREAKWDFCFRFCKKAAIKAPFYESWNYLIDDKYPKKIRKIAWLIQLVNQFTFPTNILPWQQH